MRRPQNGIEINRDGVNLNAVAQVRSVGTTDVRYTQV